MYCTPSPTTPAAGAKCGALAAMPVTLLSLVLVVLVIVVLVISRLLVPGLL